jgi:PAS domain S-box-containing protein
VIARSEQRPRNPGLPLLVGGILVAVMGLGFVVLEPVSAPVKVAVGACLLAFAAVLVWSARRVMAQWSQTREREEWLATLLRSIGDAVIATDAAGRITFMNPVAQTLTGWPEREARGQALPKVLHLIDRKTREPLGNSALRILRDGDAVTVTRPTLLVARDGREIPIADSGAPIRDASGEVTGLVMVFRDATETTHRAQLEEFANKLIESMPGIFYLYDSRRRVVHWNKNLETVTGHTAEEIPKLDPLEFFTPDSRPRARERMQKCLVEGKADVEVNFQTRSGPSGTYYVTGLRLEIDGHAHVLGIGINISDRLAAEGAQRATMRRLGRQNDELARHARRTDLLEADIDSSLRQITEVAARTLETTRASVWFYDQDRMVLHCACLYELDKERHSTGIELKAGEYPAYFRALEEERAIAASDACQDPRTCEFAEGYLRPLGIGAMLDAPIRSQGKMVGVLCSEHVGPPREWAPDEQNFAGSLADLISLSLEVARRQKAEAELRQAHDSLERKVTERTRDLEEANEQLKELDRLKSEFLATMSHELRTPLNSIIGFTGILRQGLPGPLNAEQNRQLGMVHSSARHLLGLINDLLDLSRIESGRMDMHLERFPFASVVEEVVHLLQPQVEQKKLTLETRLDDPALELETDRKKVFQILLNLANNAVKFTEKGWVRIETRTTAAGVDVTVIDSGIGIQAGQIGRLFEAFRQVDGSARRVYEGTGLGLYLCRKLVTMLGGTIGAESVFGVGSRFTFHLPRKSTGPAPS